MSARWRGTALYVASLVVIAAAVLARYGGPPAETAPLLPAQDVTITRTAVRS